MMEKLSNLFDKDRHTRQDSDTKLKEYVLDNVLDAAYLMDSQLRFVYVNNEACQALGYSRDELLGLTPPDIDPHTTPEEGARIWTTILEEGRITFEACHRRRDGSEFPVEIRCTLFEYLGQTMQLALVRDISERKRMESDLAVREYAYRSLAENLPDNIARWDFTGRYLYINATHEQTLAMSAADVIGKTIYEVFPDGPFRGIEAAIAQTIKAGQTVLFARQAVPVNGETRFHDIKFVPERDANGQIVSVLGIGRDMTELYHAQDDLAARERELRALAESSPGMMGSYHLRADGSIYMPYVSPKIEQFFGLHPQDVARDASALMALTHPDDAQRVADSFAESARTMCTWREEYRILHPTLGKRWMESNTHPEPHPDGGIIWYGYLHDITERKQAEQTEKSLTRALRLLSDSSMLPMQVKDEQELLGDACRFAVEIGGYLMAWIGIAENDENKSVRPVAQFGFSDGYVDNLQITWADNERGQVPVGIAIRTGTAAINHDFQSYSGLEPWREAAARRGFRSSIALPLLSKGQVLGSLNIYSTEIRAFGNDEEVALLQKLANNLALGIEILRTRAEKERTGMALQRREREFHSLANNLPDNIARWDLDGRYLYINPTHERLLGISAADIVGREISDTFSFAKAAVIRIATSGEAEMSVRQSIQAANGETHWHDINMVPERDVDGKVVSILGIGRDMTEFYRAQDDLAARERELRALAESSPGMMGSYHQRADGSIYMPYISPKIEELFGLHPHDVARDASVLKALTHPDDAKRVADSIAESVRTMRTWHEEYRIVHPTLGERWMESNTHPEPHPDGGIIWYGHVHDITNRKLVELEREEFRAQLRGMAAQREEVREEERRHIAREVHDELGQILSALKLNLIVLTRKFSQDVPALREQLAQITQQTDEAISVARNIATTLRPVALDLGFVPALEWLAQCFENNTGIPIEIHAQSKVVELNEQHAIALFRIVQEALTNVTRHTQASRVTIIFKPEAGNYVLIVRDDGRGFDTHAKKPKSFGLVGMKERALMLGGALSITSEVGGGTEIAVRIPIQVNKEAL